MSHISSCVEVNGIPLEDDARIVQWQRVYLFLHFIRKPNYDLDPVVENHLVPESKQDPLMVGTHSTW
jgi:hypothetical protein